MRGVMISRMPASGLSEFPNLVVTRTFSKAYGLAGLRVGYGVSSPAIAELLNRVRQPFNVNALVNAQRWQHCRNKPGLAAAVLRVVPNARACAMRWLHMGINSLPSRGNFLLAEIGDAAAAMSFCCGKVSSCVPLQIMDWTITCGFLSVSPSRMIVVWRASGICGS